MKSNIRKTAGFFLFDSVNYLVAYPAQAQGERTMTGNQTADRIDLIRAFNRFYTRHIGILDEGFLGQQYSLPEIRVLFEVAGDSSTTATSLANYLRMDQAMSAGYSPSCWIRACCSVPQIQRIAVASSLP